MWWKWTIKVIATLLILSACSENDPVTPVPPGVMPPIGSRTCKVEEIEFRNRNDEITEIREFRYDVNKNNRLELVSIVEDLNSDPINFTFQVRYLDESSEVPNRLELILGGDVITRIDFTLDAQGDLVEFTQSPVLDPSVPPQSHVFFYEESPLANDSINTRIIIFDIENLTREWIDVFPAIFTSGGQRITRFDRVSFRGDLFEFCEFNYDDQGFLEEVICRTADFVLTEVWNFTYEGNRLSSALRQLPNFWALNEYNYDSQGRPVLVTSTTNERLNWKGAYFYVCR